MLILVEYERPPPHIYECGSKTASVVAPRGGFWLAAGTRSFALDKGYEPKSLSSRYCDGRWDRHLWQSGRARGLHLENLVAEREVERHREAEGASRSRKAASASKTLSGAAQAELKALSPGDTKVPSTESAKNGKVENEKAGAGVLRDIFQGLAMHK